MSLKIPVDFNYKNELLDGNELIIRDTFNLQVSNWVKFRHSIRIGVDPKYITTSYGKISEQLKDSYLELGKSHYEVICSLGFTYIALLSAKESHNKQLLLFQKATKDFYFHIGCLLDNFARLIFILNYPNSPTEKNNKNSLVLKRHMIDWGSLNRDLNKNAHYKNYNKFFKSITLHEIINIRNALTHYWHIPFKSNTTNWLWPNIIKKRKAMPWPYAESSFNRIRKWVSIIDLMQNHFNFIESFQNKLFNTLIIDIKTFEQNHNIIIS